MPRDITDVYLRTIRPPASGRLEIRDGRVRGLVLRVTPAGLATWSVRTRTKDGKQTRPTLGTWPAMGVGDARRQALLALASVQGGADPVAEKQAARAARKALQAEKTVAERLTDWQEARAGDRLNPWSPRHALEVGRLMKRDIPAALRGKALTATTRQDWTDLIAKKRKKAPAAGSNLYRAISAFLNHAEAHGWISVPLLPRKGAAILAPPVPARERTLSDAEVKAIWQAADREAPKLRAFVRLLILTAARETEVADLRIAEIDRDARRWTIPATRAKNGMALTLPLCDLALAELAALWPNETVRDDWRLLGRSGTAPFSGFSRLKARIDIAARVSSWRWHDLRRTARTGMARLGIPREHAEAAINHISGRSALERTYDRHSYAAEVIAAMTTWQTHIATVVRADDQ